MTAILVLALLLLLAVLAPRSGADSRDLRDHPWQTRDHRTRPARRPGW
jgi:hypothetical protein